MAKKYPLTEQNMYQQAASVVVDSASAVGLNVLIGSIFGVTGALKNAPQVVLRILPGLGSALNYIMATKVLIPLINPQLHAYTAHQVAELLDISRNDADDLLAQKKTYKEVQNRRLTHQYIHSKLNQGPYAIPMAEILQMFPENISRYHTVKLANAGYEALRLVTAASVSYAMPAQITDSQEADGAIKGATALAAGDIAVSVVRGAWTWWHSREAQAPENYRSLSSQEMAELSLK